MQCSFLSFVIIPWRLPRRRFFDCIRLALQAKAPAMRRLKCLMVYPMQIGKEKLCSSSSSLRPVLTCNSTVTSWQNSSCASRTSALGLQAGAARRSVQQAQGAAAALNLLASMPSPSASDADLQGWTSTLRQQLTARPCDPALRASAHTLLSSLLSRSASEPLQSFPRARMSPPEAAAVSRLRPGHGWYVLRPD